jgi:hypothetical protein
MNLLPKELDYLEQAAKSLADDPADEPNEDVVLRLESVLRERVKGLKLRDAISRLTQDHAILKQWLTETKTEDGPVGFIAAYLSRPGPLARQLLAPPPPPEPTVSVEIAKDWVAKEFPCRLDLFKDKVLCSFTIMDKRGFEDHLWKSNHREQLQKSPTNPWKNLGVWTKNPVEFGNCRGEKSVYIQQAKANWKQVDYALEVPGGHVNIRLGHEDGKHFDETEFEQKFHTIKVLPPKMEVSA